jgi:hypothetical protein
MGWLLLLNTNGPCRGQPLCQTGVDGTGFLTGILAILMSLPKWIRRSD